MGTPDGDAGHGTPVPEPALVALVERIRPRVPDVGLRLVERYRSDIVDYGRVHEVAVRDDVLPTAIENVRELLTNLAKGQPLDEAQIDGFRAAAVRRLHQGVSIQSVLRAYRIWGQVVWAEIVGSASGEAERNAVLSAASSVMAHVDQVSGAAAQAYLEEAAGAWRQDEVSRRDLLDTLLSGRRLTDRTREQAGAVHFDLDADHLVVLLRFAGSSEQTAAMMRPAVDAARRHLRPPLGNPLVAVREDEVVVLYPVAEPGDARTAREQADAAAAALPDIVVTLGRPHPQSPGVARSYREAGDAAAVAVGTHARGRALGYADALADHILRTSPNAGDLLEETVLPLRAYDARRGTDLLHTLEVYVGTRFSLTRSATRLVVQPNTVVHRLRRIATLTGHDPTQPDGLLLLVLGVRLARATSVEAAG
jgi:sugar diacid utilization regulator